jgi:hypothetical protein
MTDRAGRSSQTVTPEDLSLRTVSDELCHRRAVPAGFVIALGLQKIRKERAG